MGSTSRERATPAVGPGGRAALAPLGKAAHPALPVPRCGGCAIPAHGPPDHATPFARVPARSTRAGRGGRIPVRPRPARRPRGSARSPATDALPAAWALDRRLALRSLSGTHRGSAAAPAASSTGEPVGHASGAAQGVAALGTGRRASIAAQPGRGHVGALRQSRAGRLAPRTPTPALPHCIPAWAIDRPPRGRRPPPLTRGPWTLGALDRLAHATPLGCPGVARDAAPAVPYLPRSSPGRTPARLALRPPQSRAARDVDDAPRTPDRHGVRATRALAAVVTGLGGRSDRAPADVPGRRARLSRRSSRARP
jgi:hypothetical protein